MFDFTGKVTTYFTTKRKIDFAMNLQKLYKCFTTKKKDYFRTFAKVQWVCRPRVSDL